MCGAQLYVLLNELVSRIKTIFFEHFQMLSRKLVLTLRDVL